MWVTFTITALLSAVARAHTIPDVILNNPNTGARVKQQIQQTHEQYCVVSTASHTGISTRTGVNYFEANAYCMRHYATSIRDITFKNDDQWNALLHVMDSAHEVCIGMESASIGSTTFRKRYL